MSEPKYYDKVCETCMQAFRTRFNRDTECAECKDFDGRLIEIPVEKNCNRCDQRFVSTKTICYTSPDEPPIITHGNCTCPDCRHWLLEFQQKYGYSEEAMEISHDSFGYR